MSARPARLVGGAGQTRDTAAPSCAFIASSFPAEAVNGVFWVLASAGDRGSGRQRLCLRNPTTGAFQENGGDGLSAINAALSCSVSGKFGERDRSRWPGMRIGHALMQVVTPLRCRLSRSSSAHAAACTGSASRPRSSCATRFEEDAKKKNSDGTLEIKKFFSFFVFRITRRVSAWAAMARRQRWPAPAAKRSGSMACSQPAS